MIDPTPEGSGARRPLLLTSLHREGSIQGAGRGLTLGLMPSRKGYSGACHTWKSHSTRAKRNAHMVILSLLRCCFSFYQVPTESMTWCRLYIFLRRRAWASNWCYNYTLLRISLQIPGYYGLLFCPRGRLCQTNGGIDAATSPPVSPSTQDLVFQLALGLAGPPDHSLGKEEREELTEAVLQALVSRGGTGR